MDEKYHIKPTTEEVVDIQLSAVLREFELKDHLDDDLNACDREELEAEIEQTIDLHETPVNLSDCKIVSQMARIRLTADGIKECRSYIQYEDILCNMFFLLGEVSQAPGHVCVLAESGKIYMMVHADMFEVIPTQEC